MPPNEEMGSFAAPKEERSNADVVMAKVMKHQSMTDAFLRARQLNGEQLAQALEQDLKESFGSLGTKTPKTIDDLQRNERTGDPSRGVTGAYSDYKNQRLAAISGFIDLENAGILSGALAPFLTREADRLATLVVVEEYAKKHAQFVPDSPEVSASV